MEKPITVGDIVWLKSGGPLMSVSEVVHDRLLLCVWFDGTVVCKAQFHRDTVNLYSPPDVEVLARERIVLADET